MEKLNEVAAFLERNPGLADCVVQITYSEMYDIAEAFRALERRDEARSKLAELEKQEPRYQIQKKPSYGRESVWIDVASREEAETNVLHGYRWRIVYDAPAPAISLAELVPDAPTGHECPEHILDPFSWMCGAGWFREALLRNIEEAK